MNINSNQIVTIMPQRHKSRPVKLMESLQATPSWTARSAVEQKDTPLRLTSQMRRLQGSIENSSRNHINRKQIWLMEMQ